MKADLNIEDFKLSKEEHELIYRIIEREVFRKGQKGESKPIAIIAGGQSGAGKGSLIGYSMKQLEESGHSGLIITTDEYKPYHPRAVELAKKYPTEYVRIIEQDVGLWTNRILKKAIDEKYSFVFEATLRNNRILDRIREQKQNGFNIIVRVLAVPKLESLLSIHERYKKQIENMGFGRLISVEQHNDAYTGIPNVIDEIERSKMCVVEVYTRGETIARPKLIYSSKAGEKKYLSARMALEEGRQSEERKTYFSAPERIRLLREFYESRHATKEEIEELDKIEKYFLEVRDL